MSRPESDSELNRGKGIPRTMKMIETPFGEYEPRIAAPQELTHAGVIMGDAVEAIARVNHDQWAMERIRQGWRYGAQRNDTKKLHPGLVPYEHLSEGEKQIDRESAKAIVAELIRLGILRS